MKVSPRPSNEFDRLRVLKELQILDTDAEKDFDDIVKLASLICGTPMSVIGLIDEERQWYKAKIGIDGSEITRDLSFCSHTIHDGEMLLVPDARQDDRFSDNPFVTAEPGIRFYLGVPLRTNEGYALGTLCVYDTQPKRMSEEQLLSLQILGNQVMKLLDLKAKIIEADRERHRAEEATRAKASFLSIMSHEIRTPMNAIVGLTNFLIQDDPKESQKECLRLMKFSSENLLSIINDVLDFSKIEARKVVLEKTDVNLHQTVADIVKMFDIRAKEKGIDLLLEIDRQVPQFVKTDSVRLSQVLSNLISNAVKFTEKGQVKVVSSIVSKEKNRSRIRFEIHDTGIGIQNDKLKLIFESFSQASSDITRKFGGTGLGLSICKSLLSSMDSELRVESVFGQGSTFNFEIVFENGDQVTTLKSSDLITPLRGKILLVDDNKVNQIVAGRFLRKWEIHFDTADNGVEALARVSENSYDLILMDIQMPELDGYQTSREMQSRGLKIPVVALTASSVEEVKDQAYASGMVDFIQKPFDPQTMHAVLAKFLQRHQ